FGDFLDSAADLIASPLPDGGPLKSLVRDGALAGVTAVLVFLPQIAILFAFLAVLEDCGYMARAAFLMDRLLSRCGLSGKSFIPMLSSFACAIPGVMATRTIEDRRDRLVTILVAPLMSCSARLPVYTLLIAAFIPAGAVLEGNWNLFGRTMDFHLVEFKTLTMLSMYMIGLVVAPLVAWSLKKTVLKGEPPVFLMELPAYKLPSILTVLHRMFDRGWAFVRRAGTLILASSVLIWALGYYPRPQSVADSFAPREEAVKELASKHGEKSIEAADAQAQLDRDLASAYQAQSYLGRMGKSIEPVVRPLGWDWKIGMAAIASFPAREVVVAALGTIYSVGAEDLDDEGSERRAALVDAMKAERRPDGSKVFTIPTALSIMVFFALCCQCVGTLAAIWRETRSLGWTVFTFVYMTTLAYFAALATYQIGIRWGTGG
ncbi:MAG TPA: ferrous iron transporter B, partial [Planctomycetia bacterium]|nr:ferrous iron transporter B [Planctomycetia bacterium]